MDELIHLLLNSGGSAREIRRYLKCLFTSSNLPFLMDYSCDLIALVLQGARRFFEEIELIVSQSVGSHSCYAKHLPHDGNRRFGSGSGSAIKCEDCTLLLNRLAFPSDQSREQDSSAMVTMSPNVTINATSSQSEEIASRVKQAMRDPSGRTDQLKKMRSIAAGLRVAVVLRLGRPIGRVITREGLALDSIKACRAKGQGT